MWGPERTWLTPGVFHRGAEDLNHCVKGFIRTCLCVDENVALVPESVTVTRSCSPAAGRSLHGEKGLRGPGGLRGPRGWVRRRASSGHMMLSSTSALSPFVFTTRWRHHSWSWSSAGEERSVPERSPPHVGHIEGPGQSNKQSLAILQTFPWNIYME